MNLEIIGSVERVELIARGLSVRQRLRLAKKFGRGQWRKLKGEALVRLPSGAVRRAELHWYEAHGVGRRAVKIKRYLE